MACVCHAKWRHYPQRFYDLLPGEVMHHWRKGNGGGIIELNIGSSKVAKVFFLCLQKLCILIHVPLLAGGKELEFTRFSASNLKLQLEVTFFYQFLITVLQFNVIFATVFSSEILWVSGESVWSKLTDPPFLEEVWTLVCHFLPQLRSISSHSSHSVPSSGASGDVSLGSSCARRSRHSPWGQRPLDHNTTKNHCQTPPNKSKSILSNCWDNNTIVQNTPHSVGALQLLLNPFFGSVYENIKLLSHLAECHLVFSVCS